MLAQLVSLFLSLSPDCAIVFPGQFSGSGSADISVCLTAPPYCGVTYGLTSSSRVNSRRTFIDQDLTQAPAIPFTASSVNDLGFTTLNLVPFPAATRKEIARYNLTYSQNAIVQLRSTNAIVSVAQMNACQDVYVDVPIDGKLPAPVAIGVKP